ncbi:MAG TPA: DUF4383 domain-containing protein [Blastocatellia bacterium]|nr:DUF4383 domain-containing protein [Blastocatellia bacterium]
MAKTVAKLVGVVFIAVGIVGFFEPNLLGAHLGKTHNVVHLASGVVSLYLGLKGSLGAARTFCIVFGIVYGLLGAAGFVAGAAPDYHLAITEHLNLMTRDHIIHIAIGVLYLIGGFSTKSGG